MSYQDIVKKIKPEFDKAIEYFKGELSKIRTGRASPSMVENVEIDCYGTKLKLTQLATISASQPRQLVIQPWDKNSISAIEKGLLQADLGASPTVDGELIRLTIPPPTQERREEYLKIVRAKIEEARVSIRRKREEAWDEIQDLFQEGKIREDDKFKGKDELQELIDEYNGKVEELGKRKEEEILTV